MQCGRDMRCLVREAARFWAMHAWMPPHACLLPRHALQMFWQKQSDVKAVAGWSEDTVVIAFRGTASLSNLATDSQVGACMTAAVGPVPQSLLWTG